jgi:hypothetical protein
VSLQQQLQFAAANASLRQQRNACVPSSSKTAEQHVLLAMA